MWWVKGNNHCLAELNAVASHGWGSGGSCSAESAGEALGVRGSGGCVLPPLIVTVD